MTNSNCVDLPACFFLKMNQPMPFSLSFIQRMGNATCEFTFCMLYSLFINTHIKYYSLFKRFNLNLCHFFSPAIPVFETPPTLSPLYQLIVQSQLQRLEEGSSPPPPPHNMHFYSVSRHYVPPQISAMCCKSLESFNLHVIWFRSVHSRWLPPTSSFGFRIVSITCIYISQLSQFLSLEVSENFYFSF